MCGRYSLHAHPDVIALYFKLGLAPVLTPRYNITPGTNIMIVRADQDRGRIAEQYRWGLIPGWAKDPSIGNKLANARSETVAEKPSFRNAFKRSRCLIPASGFYEWKTIAGRKQPYFIHSRGEDLFAFAGLAERWQSPEGPVYSCAIITTEANEFTREIHNRMPVILAPEDHAAWLDPDPRTSAALKELLKPCPSALMAAHPVSARVNNPKHDDPALIENWGQTQVPGSCPR